MITHSPIILDDIRPTPSKARSRKTDPKTSHDAAKRVELGKAELQRQWIKDALISHDMTVPEICEHLRKVMHIIVLPHELGKRIGEIENIAPTGEVRNGSRVWSIL